MSAPCRDLCQSHSEHDAGFVINTFSSCRFRVFTVHTLKHARPLVHFESGVTDSYHLFSTVVSMLILFICRGTFMLYVDKCVFHSQCIRKVHSGIPDSPSVSQL